MAKVKTVRSDSAVPWMPSAFNWGGEAPSCPQPNVWVKLLVSLNPFCHEEALLLCQESEAEWLAWVPDHGEAVLHISQFSCFS